MEERMNFPNKPTANLRHVLFNEDDYFNEEVMMQKLDQLIHAFATELFHKQQINQIPGPDEGWATLLRELPSQNKAKDWEGYVIGCLVFFIKLQDAIREEEFLVQNDIHRSYKFIRWDAGIKSRKNPMLERLLKQFYKCYCMIQEKEPIRVRYMDYT
jgi:hypothetical protein